MMMRNRFKDRELKKKLKKITKLLGKCKRKRKCGINYKMI